jgi:hypothetical protein
MTTVTVPRGDLIVPGIPDDLNAVNYQAAAGATVTYPADNPRDPDVTVFDLSGWATLLVNFRLVTGTAARLVLQWCDHPAPAPPVALVEEHFVVVSDGGLGRQLSAVLPVLAPYLYVKIVNNLGVAATGRLSIRPSRLTVAPRCPSPAAGGSSLRNLLNLSNIVVGAGVVVDYVFAPFFGRAHIWTWASGTNVEIALWATDENAVDLFRVDNVRSRLTAAQTDLTVDVPIPAARMVARITNLTAGALNFYVAATAYDGT